MHQLDLGVEVRANEQQFILSVQNVLADKFVGRDRAISFLNTGAQCLRQSNPESLVKTEEPSVAHITEYQSLCA